MTAVPNAEYNEWDGLRSGHQRRQGEAICGIGSAATGGSTGATEAPNYKNQQAGDFKNELKVDANLGAVEYDEYRLAPQGAFGYPVTSEMEQQVLEAALDSKYTVDETIPAQNQIALMQAARKAHNNWRQRRQQLLTHAQERAANRVVIKRDFDKMASGLPLDGVPT